MSNVLSIVSYTVLPAKTGGQKGIALFYKYFSRQCQLVCITTKRNDPVYADGYRVINCIADSPLRYINIFLFFSMYRMLRKSNATHLLLEHPYYGWLGYMLQKTSGVKLIVHSHNIEFQRWKGLHKWWWPILKKYERFTHRHARYNFFKTENDLNKAIGQFGLDANNCRVITYGIESAAIPSGEEKNQCKKKLRELHTIASNDTIVLFNGSLNYRPNLRALQAILTYINPLLLQNKKAYKIIICGGGLPSEMDGLKAYKEKNIIYTGFVNDISLYFKGADIFINPVTEGGGIQTKLVEALSYNLNAVTTGQGSIGIPVAITGTKMKVVADNDWAAFAAAMETSVDQLDIPSSFFEHFYWENIAKKAAAFIDDQED